MDIIRSTHTERTNIMINYKSARSGLGKIIPGVVCGCLAGGLLPADGFGQLEHKKYFKPTATVTEEAAPPANLEARRAAFAARHSRPIAPVVMPRRWSNTSVSMSNGFSNRRIRGAIPRRAHSSSITPKPMS
jgi:hypothetical protein